MKQTFLKKNIEAKDPEMYQYSKYLGFATVRLN